MRVQLKREDLQRIIRKANPARLLAPLRAFFRDAALVVERHAKERSPVKTGTLRRDISSTVDPSPPPRWARIGTSVRNRGVLYSQVLNESERHHYRVHPLFAGEPTRGWFTEHALNDSKNELDRLVERTGAQLRGEWEQR